MTKKRNAQESTVRNDRASLKRDNVLRTRLRRDELSDRAWRKLTDKRIDAIEDLIDHGKGPFRKD